MPISCPHCAAEMPDTAAYCPGCGRSMLPVERVRGMVGMLPETLAGALAYLLLPAIGFLLVAPYNKNRFVRFHSFQCLGFFLVGVVVVATLRVLGFLLYFVPVIGHFLVWLVSMVVALAFFMVWVVLIVKALQGEMFKLPLVGEYAEQQTPAS
ncbi:MAG: zinc-ribbon domain-containing protein [Candidatus Sulfotelmatobacter sp.]